MNKRIIVILGPTASGKTEMGIRLAESLQTEIISADSRQIYKELKIGTAPPTRKQLERVPHHFIGNKSIHDYYNASMFETEALSLLTKLFSKHDDILMIGGSGMYINAVCSGIDDIPTVDPEIRLKLREQYEKEGIESLRIQLKMLDPVYYNSVDLRNPNRILKGLEISVMTGKPYSSFLSNKKKERDFRILKIGILSDREKLYERINHRVDEMIRQGLIEEARKMYPLRELNALNTVGYKELFAYFDHQISKDEAIELLKRNTRRFAKRQMTWFLRDKEIQWFEFSEENRILELIQNS
jgi:tRNA dimethylallyltransferase